MSQPRRYAVEHETRYVYDAPVAQSWQLAHLTPRLLPWQRLVSHALAIDPLPDERRDGADSYGNTVTRFALHGAHHQLRVRMQALVEVGERPQPVAADDLPWEAVRDALRDTPSAEALAAALLAEPTRLVALSERARAYAAPLFTGGRAWLDALDALTTCIHEDFAFEPGATTISTSVDEVLRGRRGVCQDFAHLMLACLRGHGLAARYVSGFLLTDPPPGEERLLGVDVSHAWVAAWSPVHGWVDWDPTNNQRADARYTTLAWGGDFADVAPLAGVILGGGEQALDTRVSVVPQ